MQNLVISQFHHQVQTSDSRPNVIVPLLAVGSCTDLINPSWLSANKYSLALPEARNTKMTFAKLRSHEWSSVTLIIILWPYIPLCHLKQMFSVSDAMVAKTLKVNFSSDVLLINWSNTADERFLILFLAFRHRSMDLAPFEFAWRFGSLIYQWRVNANSMHSDFRAGQRRERMHVRELFHGGHLLKYRNVAKAL